MPPRPRPVNKNSPPSTARDSPPAALPSLSDSDSDEAPAQPTVSVTATARQATPGDVSPSEDDLMVRGSETEAMEDSDLDEGFAVHGSDMEVDETEPGAPAGACSLRCLAIRLRRPFKLFTR